jgi:small subunit ribosomal protein S4
MPRRKHKNYRKPKKPFDSARIKQEDQLIKKYGLKNKREIWKAESAIANIRKQAKLLLTKEAEAQEEFIERLKKKGFVVASIADVLALDKEDYLKRRLQSVVVGKKLATTPRQARQFIVHKHISIHGEKINIPSYIVPVEEEDKINLMLVRKEKKAKKIEEVIKKQEENKEVEEKKDEKNA